MYKLLMLTTCIAAALATSNPQPSACTNQKAADNPNQIVKTVEVGPGGLKYVPNSVSFLDEDKTKEWFVVFKFSPKNHTVTESSFDEPCIPLAKSKAVAANASIINELHPGLKSGFVPVTGTENFTRTFTVKVNDTKPIWIYCGQKGHCQGGMVMVINQAKTGNKTIDAYMAKAKAFVDTSDSGSASAIASPAASTSAAVTPAPTATGANSAPAGQTPTSSSSSPTSLVSVFTAAAPPTQRPVHFVALGGLAVAGAVALL